MRVTKAKLQPSAHAPPPARATGGSAPFAPAVTPPTQAKQAGRGATTKPAPELSPPGSGGGKAKKGAAAGRTGRRKKEAAASLPTGGQQGAVAADQGTGELPDATAATAPATRKRASAKAKGGSAPTGPSPPPAAPMQHQGEPAATAAAAPTATLLCGKRPAAGGPAATASHATPGRQRAKAGKLSVGQSPHDVLAAAGDAADGACSASEATAAGRPHQKKNGPASLPPPPLRPPGPHGAGGARAVASHSCTLLAPLPLLPAPLANC